jgi:hypothetical protein
MAAGLSIEQGNNDDNNNLERNGRDENWTNVTGRQLTIYVIRDNKTSSSFAFIYNIIDLKLLHD